MSLVLQNPIGTRNVIRCTSEISIGASGLNKIIEALPQDVQVDFRERIREVGEQTKYYVGRGWYVEFENNRKITREYFLLTTPTSGEFCSIPDEISSLYIKIERVVSDEEVEEESLNHSERIGEPITCFSALVGIMQKIKDLLLEIFEGLRSLYSCG